MVSARVHFGISEPPDAGVLIAVIGDVDYEAWRAGAHIWVRRLDAPALRIVPQKPVQNRRVRGVEPTFEPLQPIALLDYLADVPVRSRYLRPGKFRQRRNLLCRTHIGPDEAAQFAGWIGGQAHLVFEQVFLGLIHLVDAAAVDGEFPAMVDATQPALFVAPEPQGCAAMWTIFVEQPDTAVAVAKRD